DSIRALQRVITRPDTFDVYHQWHTADIIWTARAIQAIDLRRVSHGGVIKAQAAARSGDGRRIIGSPFDDLFVQPSGAIGAAPTDSVVMLPLMHGADGFGYVPSVRDLWPEDAPESWGWMLDERLHGRVGILNDPVLGMIEAALAIEAAGEVSFSNVGNLT